MHNLKEIPHIIFILIAFIFSGLLWAYSRDASFLPVLITLAGILGGLSQKVQKDQAGVKNESVENQEINVTQTE